MQNLYLGVDGGGTKTKATLLDESQKILKEVVGEGSNHHIYGLETSFQNLKKVVKETLTGFEDSNIYGSLALAGVDFKNDFLKWQEIIESDQEFISLFKTSPKIINDTKAALKSGTDSKNAVVIISGTGSNCFGQNEEGEEAFCGGEDYILSDQGSGYWIGLQILKEVTKSLDGRGKETFLQKLLFEKYSLASLEDLAELVYKKPWDKKDISDVATILEEGVKEGDLISLQIQEEATGHLVDMIKAVVLKLGLEDFQFVLVASGSVINPDSSIFKSLEKKVREFYKNVEITHKRYDSSFAAAILAKETLHS